MVSFFFFFFFYIFLFSFSFFFFFFLFFFNLFFLLLFFYILDVIKLPSALAVLHGRLGDGLLHLGILTEAERYLCLSLDELNPNVESVDVSKTWINAPEGGKPKKQRLSVSVEN